MDDPTPTRNLTPPQIAQRLGVAPRKVIQWIVSGELRALNLASRGSRRPRYSVSLDALRDFEQARTVVPQQPVRTGGRLRRRLNNSTKDYFPT
jgi:hypothetical protein